MINKIKFLAVMMVCFIGFTSCEGEEENDFVRQNYVAGTWKVSEIGALNAQNTLNYAPVVPEEGCDAADSFTFNEDMSYSVTTYAVAEGVCDDTIMSGTYEVVNGNVELSTVVEGQTVKTTYDLLALTNVLMEVVYTDTFTNKLVFVRLTKVTE